MNAVRNFLLLAAYAALPAALLAQNPPPTQPPPTSPPPVVVTPTQATAAQAAAAAMGKSVTNDQISTAIRASGLSEAQVRAKLQAAGYSPSLADPFFQAVGQQAPAGGAPAGAAAAPDAGFVNALVSLGILTSPTTPAGQTQSTTTGTDTTKATPLYGGVFGKEIFNRASSAFDPVTSGPVDPAYRLGTGDQLQLILTGQVELAYQLTIGRDGTVIVPQVGLISLAGLTMDAARELLRIRMGASYSGIKSGATRLDLTISQIRSIAVFVIGEVEQPGAIQVNALATVFYAIAKAGGPSDRGSFRGIQVRRGGKTIETLDLYDYLLKGDASGDIRLEQGDVVFVPLDERAVAVVGAVRRPRIFELKHDEGFNDLLRYSGGLMPTASTDRVQIDRILPPSERKPGFERVKVDVYLHGDLDSLARVALNDADIVTVFTIGDVRRNVVTIAGQVYQPGDYQLKPDMTLGQLINDAQGFLPWAVAGEVKILRPIIESGQARILSVDATSPRGKALPLTEFDSVIVLDGRLAYPQGIVAVSGAVHNPQVTPYAENETLADAIQRAGGFLEHAQLVDVYRRLVRPEFSDTTSQLFTFAVTATFFTDSATARFPLTRDDRIEVRTSPGFRAQEFVTLSGAFVHSGSYAIAANVDRIRDVIQRAGGTLPGAYDASFQLIRDGKPVATDFASAMGGNMDNNMRLVSGDSLRIGRNSGTVLVAGAVNRPSLVKFQDGRPLQYYIDMAGGIADTGRVNAAIVDYPSGFSRKQKREWLFFHSSPQVIAGATVTVPFKPAQPPATSDWWARILTSTSALASLVIAFAAVKRL